MLLNNFFYINELSQSEQGIRAAIQINADHDILKGHFPQQPVVPGVCVLEMLKEVLQLALTRKLMMTESVMIKFLTIFTPERQTGAVFEIDHKMTDDKGWQVSATLKHEDITFLKFKGVFTEK
jgi:3-hydroxyacyl-[acyl-carrier-protein] dehydratase